jgi:drug/metabolite transporter (DMT)-like permease
MKVVFLVAITSVLSTLGNILWKMQFSKQPLDLSSVTAIAYTFISWKVLLGIASYFISMVLFFYLLSNFKMSVVIPLQAMTYILNVAVAFTMFKEKISLGQLLGSLIIMFGIIVLIRSTNPSVETGVA